MDVTRIFDILEAYKTTFGHKSDAFGAKTNGSWKKYSSADYVNNATLVSYGLLALGLKPGDRVASVSNNRPEWNFVDMGMNQAGIIHVPIYPTISDADFKYILNHCEPKLLIVSDKNLYNKLAPMASSTKSIIKLYTFNQVEGCVNYNEILQLGKESENKFAEELVNIKNKINSTDLATIIYTSGTTGNPKGVMLSHKNILSNIEGIIKVFNFNESHKALSFLPISHIYERTINYYFQYKGLSVYYAESLATIGDNLTEVQPNVFIAVPRVLEKVYNKIIGKGKDLSGIRKRLFFWAVNLGHRFEFNRKNGWFYHVQLKIADKLIFSKWREAVGGKVDVIVVGGAAMQPRLIRIFNAAGIPCVEGYGMTETSPVIATNSIVLNKVSIGTVGPILPGIKVKISDDGEILTKSDCIMQGYYKESALTKEAIDPEGWMHTGDIGVMIDNEFLKITDRKKEIFKLSSGKYVAPQAIENKFKESFFIEQVFVFGENQKFASALIVPNFPFLHEWCSRHQVKYQDNEELIAFNDVIQRYQREVNYLNSQLGQTEHIKRFRLVSDDWSPQTGELSPTLKLKRRFIFEKYKGMINEIYSVDQVGKKDV